jgi:hypothetical protein
VNVPLAVDDELITSVPYFPGACPCRCCRSPRKCWRPRRTLWLRKTRPPHTLPKKRRPQKKIRKQLEQIETLPPPKQRAIAQVLDSMLGNQPTL